MRLYYVLHELSNLPRGPAGVHLRSSLQIASTNGSAGRSSNVGSRSLLVTASSSRCAIVWILGWSKAATKKDITEATVWKSIRLDWSASLCIVTYRVSPSYEESYQPGTGINNLGQRYVAHLHTSTQELQKAPPLPSRVLALGGSLSLANPRVREMAEQCH